MKYFAPQITPQEPKRPHIVLGLEITAILLWLDTFLSLGTSQFSAAFVSCGGGVALLGFARAIRYIQLILWRMELGATEETLRALGRETEVMVKPVRKAEQEEIERQKQEHWKRVDEAEQARVESMVK
jgi:hypothetical protein